MPAEVGIQKPHDQVYGQPWTPAFAGVTAHADWSSTPFQNGLGLARPGLEQMLHRPHGGFHTGTQTQLP